MDPVKRPDYVRCIRKGTAKEGICGRYLGFDFAFADAEHVKAAESSGSRLILCEDCRKTKATALAKIKSEILELAQHCAQKYQISMEDALELVKGLVREKLDS